MNDQENTTHTHNLARALTHTHTHARAPCSCGGLPRAAAAAAAHRPNGTDRSEWTCGVACPSSSPPECLCICRGVVCTTTPECVYMRSSANAADGRGEFDMTLGVVLVLVFRWWLSPEFRPFWFVLGFVVIFGVRACVCVLGCMG